MQRIGQMNGRVFTSPTVDPEFLDARKRHRPQIRFITNSGPFMPLSQGER
jgi:hypothetical protein